MVDDDTATSEGRLEAEKELDPKVVASEDTDGDVGNTEMGVCASASEDPPEEARQPRKWKWAVIFLCFYGFMSSLKPGEPFITPYLLSPEKNFTRKEVGDVHSVHSCVCLCEGKENTYTVINDTHNSAD